MTKVEAIKKLMEDNEGVASWSLIYEDIEKYYPNAKKSKDWKAGIRGVLYRDLGKNFKKIDDGLFAIINFNENEYIEKNEILITDTTKEIKIRIGQNLFRKTLLKELIECPFTQIDKSDLLIASHIKPWAMSNDYERLDKNNGFIFSPTYDKLFDKGYISFKNDKRLIISNILDFKTINLLNLKNNEIIERLPVKNRENYLEYHRDCILK